jgi:putative inorganic carbon (hco3(-)) transporter
MMSNTINISDSTLNLNLIFVAIIMSIVFILVGNYAFLLTILIVPVIIKHESRYVIFGIIVSLSILISDINEYLRLIVVLASGIYLLFAFLKKYGIKFENYQAIQKPLNFYFLILSVSLFFSTIFSLNVFNSLIEVIRTGVFFLFIYILYSLLNDVKDLVYVIAGVIVASIIISLSIWLNFLNSDHDIASLIAQNQFRAIGLYSNVNAPGSYIIATIPFSFSFLFYEKLKKYRYILFLIILLMLVAISLTASRSALMGIFVASLVAIYLTNIKLFKSIIWFLLLVLLIILSLPSLNELATFYLRFDSGLTYRQDLWDISFGMFNDHPLTGIGPGNYTQTMLNYFPLMFDSWKAEIILLMRDVTAGSNLSHNFYIAMLSDLGILGLISAVYLTIIFFYMCSKLLIRYKNEKDLFNYYLIVSAFSGGIGIFIRSFFEGIGIMTYGWIKMDLPFWILFIILLFFSRKNEIKNILD